MAEVRPDPTGLSDVNRPARSATESANAVSRSAHNDLALNAALRAPFRRYWQAVLAGSVSLFARSKIHNRNSL